jgi:transcriptional regulator with XRE-family HTH domain
MNVKRLRERKRWTQVQLAAKAKLHRVSVAKIESGALTPRLQTLGRIAKALGVPVTRLLE